MHSDAHVDYSAASTIFVSLETRIRDDDRVPFQGRMNKARWPAWLKTLFLSGFGQRLLDPLDQVLGLSGKLAAWIQSQVTFVFRQRILSAMCFEQEIAGEQVCFWQAWFQPHCDIYFLPRLFQVRPEPLCILV
jgi:hypothetical protein